MHDAIRRLEFLADKAEQELLQKRDKLERLQSEVAELEKKVTSLRLSAKELAASEMLVSPDDGGRESGEELRAAIEAILARYPQGLHHRRLREELAVAGHQMSPERARTVLYNFSRRYDEEFNMERGVLSLRRPKREPSLNAQNRTTGVAARPAAPPPQRPAAPPPVAQTPGRVDDGPGVEDDLPF